jgi:hypothetical protein
MPVRAARGMGRRGFVREVRFAKRELVWEDRFPRAPGGLVQLGVTPFPVGPAPFLYYYSSISLPQAKKV